MRTLTFLGVISLTATLWAQSLQLPISLEPLRHERELFDWNPEFQLNVPSFGLDNRPYIRSRADDRDTTGFVHVLANGKWEQRDFAESVRSAVPGFQKFVNAGGWHGARIVFDTDGHAYTLVRAAVEKETRNLLLHSTDECRTWTIYELPAGIPHLQHSARPEPLDTAPAILLLNRIKPHPARWADYSSLVMLVPTKKPDGSLDLGQLIPLTDRCFGLSQHSGNAPFLARIGNKLYVTWGEVVDEPRPDEGSPICIAIFDTTTRTLGEKVVLAHTFPANDGHNTPGIVFDSQKYLHVLTGSHGADFFYTRSNAPNDIHAGWSEPVRTLTTGWREDDGAERGRQTYLSLVCDSRDTLHIAYRHWIRNTDDRFPGGYYPALSYQRKPAGGSWSAPTKLVAAPISGYGIYYHAMAIDCLDRIFISYSYYTIQEGSPYFTPDHSGIYRFRAMLVSPDAGLTWRLPDTRFFRAAIEE